MTKKEAVVIEAYTGVCMLKGEDRNLFFKYINQLMGRKVYMYETLALEREIKEKAEPDFIKICKNMDKKIRTRKFRAITNGEICGKWKEIHTFCRIGEAECPFFGVVDCRPRDFKAKPFQTKDGKYILREVKE